MPDDDANRTSLTSEEARAHTQPILLTDETPKKFGKLKARVIGVGQKASVLGKTVVDKYRPAVAIPRGFLQKYRPYLDKAVLMVAVAAAGAVLNDREKMEAVYQWMLKLVPSSIRLFLPEKILFNALWLIKDDLIKKFYDYRKKLVSSGESKEEIQRLTDEVDQSIEELEKTDAGSVRETPEKP
ncbi:hypothetical protein [Acetobacter orleanensis]|uniref:Uncharacterized protein n=1 Tax=Acetobacter orleanensis TaxID=104099 RepID=A0A4Y3TNC9_9PROT|nr:hypothetical protein [Acetobacter orleanensis]KXV63018.1 hypothetical protein AD949_08290 [Acetobacter orleanensis]PCD78832.1 hypothetical protein CO710_10210 [Acetobacter orleanensis]GAN68827.1 hypothetical protein Abol_022_041 [Acetobacter orleanensis JCM 7639]GBR24314.1 hypothetical protein AA0473_0601 [Acetobacter orleanensis NRIC 0473]GEB83318.1 hypothetical protein AOR01nite_17950 [Acetobacter orleanensis]